MAHTDEPGMFSEFPQDFIDPFIPNIHPTDHPAYSRICIRQFEQPSGFLHCLTRLDRYRSVKTKWTLKRRQLRTHAHNAQTHTMGEKTKRRKNKLKRKDARTGGERGGGRMERRQ